MYFLDPPSKLRFHKSIGIRMSGFSWSFTITATHYAYLNFLNKGIDPFRMQVPNCFDYPFGFCWCKWRFNHGIWCCYAFESFNCASRKKKAWRNTTWHECLPMVVRRKIVQKSGAHLSRSFSMGSSIVS